jgi:hypothetical protein
VRWRLITNEGVTTSSLSGYTQVRATPGSRWSVSLDMPQQAYDARRQLKGYIDRLNSREHLVAMWDPALPLPAGTIATAGVVVGANAAQFAGALVLHNCGAGATLLAGSWVGVGGMRLAVGADATANGAGQMTVEIRPALRVAVAAGAAVTLASPSSTMMLQLQGNETPHVPWGPSGMCPAFTLDLVERWV